MKLKKIFEFLETEWKKRIGIVEQGETPKKIFQRNLFYKCRTATIKKYGQKEVCNFSYFKYTLIYKLEDKYRYMREKLEIYAKPDASLYTRHGIELIEYEHRFFPVMCLLATEKSGIAESLAEYLTKYGIYVIDTTGNQGRYPIELIEKRTDIPRLCLEDFDITGCFMSERFVKVGVKRINLLELAKKLGLNEKDLWEEDAGGYKSKHRNSISEEDKKLLFKDGKYRRIEIDTILQRVEPEDFAMAVLDFIDILIPVKDMRKVMELGDWIYMPLIPEKERQKIVKQIKSLGEKYSEQRENILNRYNELEQPFVELDLNSLEAEAKEIFENEN